ncbi:MAG: TonB-dependent receptor [Hydrocarboniphaga sp.]|uniref:TonB-dependent receptor n=1 Tax=Hydrocarboniphaga sp. TaxID=2033016 RepID=UPI0026337C61|nr:TonB-dependent receptor [Hydrocarboniphaga sp.]MDB5970255.1 TonB-dependent receptor [Hydrocarboniphaga sp.]
MHRTSSTLLGLLLLSSLSSSFAQNLAATTLADAPPAELEEIVVFGITPFPGGEGDLQHYPGNAQVFGADSLRDRQSLNLSEFLGSSASSVHLSDAANNPFQADLFYRGYGVSPLLGLPQGLAVYQDGVRVNEPFGDTVNWDLIPEAAIQRVELIPGSNPVFGQNTLGGALSVHTKTGWDQPGVEAEVSGGSFGRISSSLEYGVAGDDTALFAALQTEDEDGWRDHSASRVRQLFTRASYGKGDDGADLIVTAADNQLRGNGAVPIELMLAEGRDAVFTYPDQTAPQLFFVDLLGRHRLDEKSTLSGGVYYRQNRIHAFNGDGSEFAACADPGDVDAQGQPLLCDSNDGDEAVINDADGKPVTASDTNDSATQNTSSTIQRGYGANLQWAYDGLLLQRRNRVYLGASYDRGRTLFHSETELGALTDERGTVGSGIYDEESLVSLRAINSNIGVFASDVWQATDRLSLTASGRFNRAEVKLTDLGEDDDLDGNHHFSRFNPLLGATYELGYGLTLFGSVSEASRAPTPVELSCANPDAPCKLPNGFVDDPPLKPVITRTFEIGLRGGSKALHWNGALYRGVSRNDIIFITDGALSNEGYFSNVGNTLRQGAEFGIDWAALPSLKLSASYTYVDAEFRENFQVNTPNHPLRDPDDPEEPAAGTGDVHSGDRIPLVPQHLFRAAADWHRGGTRLGLEMVARSSSRYRGDEANLDPQRIGGFAIFNGQVSQDVGRHLTLFGKITNLLDTHYNSFGVYGDSAAVLGEDYEDARRFVGPGAPRGVFVGVRMSFAGS